MEREIKRKRAVGIFDKNGVPIMEGDKVRTKYGRVCIVVYKIYTSGIYFDQVPLGDKENLKFPPPDEHDWWDSQYLEVIK